MTKSMASVSRSHCLRLMALIALIGLLAAASAAWAENWPGWRGPRNDGSSLETNIPLDWSGTKNVAWKTAIPGKGHSSPVIWEDAVFLVTAIKETEQRVLIKLDYGTGAILWQRDVLKVPMERLHKLNSHASSTPATDGECVYVSFLDREQMFVAAYDYEGNLVWKARPGIFSSVHGYCSSPILWKDTVIVNGDHDGPGYIVALNRKTGKTVWKTPRPNLTRSYCPFLIRTIDGRDQMVLSGSMCVASYDPNTGKQHWIIDGPTEQYVASLVYNGEYFFLTCGFPDRFIQAIRPDGSGNVTDTHVVWQTTEDCSYVPSPIAWGPYFLVVSDRGIASCLDAKSGGLMWRQDLDEKHSASLVSSEDRVYFLADDGVMTVVEPGPGFKAVARNELGEETRASPAISQGKMLLRGVEHLYCIQSGE